ncbi:Fungalysin metallopeptidase-domain-containing protein [Mycena crocata]|nr:Fungalysin metallopeptidase-domain-containing protein [Mycena crocata]
MLTLNKFFTSVLLAVVYSQAVLATPAPESAPHASARHTTHRRRELPNGLTLESFHPAGTYETFGEGIDHPLRKRDGATLQESAVAFIEDKLSIKAENAAFTSGFSASHASHAYAKQSHDGISFVNAVANVAFNADDKVVAFGSSFVTPSAIADSTPTIPFEVARTTAEEKLGGSHEGLPEAELKYFAKEDGSAALVHAFQVRDEEAGTWFQALVDAHSGELISVVDYVAAATYRVIPIKKQSIPEGFEILTNPFDTFSSPNGWHSTVAENSTVTSGNNVRSYKGSQTTGVTSQSSAGLNFTYIQDASQQPTVAVNVAAAIVNNFYIINSLHDILYRYGFTEAAFNFQNDNGSKGGRGGDRVTASVQDSAGTNNALFGTPPDGQSGHMQMFRFTVTSPGRDGALQNDIVTHEFGHGLTNRLTGGGTAACLQTLEAGGMGEGWSDALSEWTEQKSAAIKDFVTGTYVLNNQAGVRTHPYSTSKTVNPLTYASIASLNEVHNIGEVWANILHNVYAALVGEHGFSDAAFTDVEGTEGNIVYLHLFVDALPLQPCEPTLPTARDAWIQADVNRYGGANKCLLWKAFASRGLGVGARNHVDSATVPADCA